MYRSFTERILGGVCGGLATRLRINLWLLRLIVVALAVGSQGAAAVMYLALWWAIPQDTPIEDTQTGVGRWFPGIGIIIVIVGLWVGTQGHRLQGPSGQHLFAPALLLTLSTIFLLRQMGKNS